MAFREAWAGLRPATKDFLPVIGPSPSIGGLLYASGHYRNGILLSALTAAAISAMVMGRKLEHDLSLFSPARFKHGQIDHSIKPNMTRL